MKQIVYDDLEDFWKSLPNAGDVSTFWQDIEKEIPNCVDAIILQDDMFDTVGMASIMLYRMREHNMKVPVFYLIGDYNPLLKCENTEKMRNIALNLGIKNINIRSYNIPEMKDRIVFFKRELEGKKVAFVTSLVRYLPLKLALGNNIKNCEIYFNVANETIEDALTWVNCNAAAGGLVLLNKIATWYSASGLLSTNIKSYSHLNIRQKMKLKFSVMLHQHRIRVETTLMIRNYQRLFRKRHWAY